MIAAQARHATGVRRGGSAAGQHPLQRRLHASAVAKGGQDALLFGWLKDQTGLWSSCFMVLFVLVAACALWMHASVRRMGRPAAMQAA